MIAINSCPTCGAVLSNDAPGGLCPRCLLKRGLDSGVDIEPKGPGKGTAAYKGPFVAPLPGELAPLFPQLEIMELLGQGGMGAVYKARQANLDRFVALKILPSEACRDPAFAERFLREARALARLNHPNIVAVYDFGEAHSPQQIGRDGLCYFIMEYVDGVNVRQVMRAGTLKADDAIKIIPQVCDALHYAHEEGIVHRDIKPENILIDKKGRVKIADFGLAKLLGTGEVIFTLTSPQQVMGTIHYMAPEQMEKPHTVDHRADIYSLGVVFYEMLTGELPLGRFPLPSQWKHLDHRLDEVVLRTLEKEPAKRYQRASEVKLAVEKIGVAELHGGRPVPVAIPVDAAEPGAPRPRNAQEELDLEMSRMAVKAPAAGLYLVAILYVLAGIVGFVAGIAIAATERRGSDAAIAALLGIGAIVVGPLLGGIVFYGARQMVRLQSYEWAMFGSIVALLPLPSPGFLLGLIGIWSLIVLRRSDVRMAFVRKAMNAQERLASRPAPSGALPVLLERYGGFWESKGLVRLGDDALYMEADVGVLASKVRQCKLAFNDIGTIILQRGWTSDTILITTTTLSALSDMPGAKGGELKLKVLRDHRSISERVVATVLARMSPMHAGVMPAYTPSAKPQAATDPYVDAPRERGAIGKVFHSFAKAAKNLFVETSFETKYSEVKSPVQQVAPASATPRAAPVAMPVQDMDDRVQLELARMQVRGPAIAMMVVAFLTFGFWWVMSLIAYFAGGPHDRENVWMPVVLSFSIPVLAVFFLLLTSARRMLRLENHGLATFASYLVRIPFSPFFLLGLPFGLWARRVLKRLEVREAFARQAILKSYGSVPSRPWFPRALLYGVPVVFLLGYIAILSSIAIENRHHGHMPMPVSSGSLFQAAQRGDASSVRRIAPGMAPSFINSHTQNGRNALHVAVAGGYHNIVEYLLEHGADANMKEQSTLGDTPLLMALNQGFLQVARALLTFGADVNRANHAGVTPLMRASEGGHLSMVDELLGRNAQVNARTPQGQTALHLAAGAGQAEIVKLLLERGASISAVSDNGRTVLHQAVYQGNGPMIALLLESGAKTHVNQQDKSGETPLARAVWKGHADAEKMLREAGAVETPNILFQRAYSLALRRQYADAIPLLHNLLEKPVLALSEPAWRLEIGGQAYEISVPYLLTQLVLAECYKRTGKTNEWETHLKACQAVWPKGTENYQLYTRRIKNPPGSGYSEVVETYSLTLQQLQAQIDSKDKLPVKGWINFRSNQQTGTVDGVIY